MQELWDSYGLSKLIPQYPGARLRFFRQTVFETAPEHDFDDYIKKMCRIITELGADAIKTFYTGDRFAEVVEGTPVPIFALGAEKLNSEVDALRLAHKAVNAGARGVVFGRNVIQARNPVSFLHALKSVVQGQATPAEAVVHHLS